MKTSKPTPKPLLAAQYQVEARRLAGCATSIERQFLSVSLDKGKQLEPLAEWLVSEPEFCRYKKTAELAVFLFFNSD
ncbi:hypothetical protein EPZ47_00095 [Pseudomonas viciae]|uniref:Uncharacterized protein n=1 Tax=Pseudomonas viciae TaxID=2505979 RepID=A0A4P7P9S3_9PSED|nr:hypothetical protein [Pseudomonas viciae]QBZ87178.1 hypothetical protein EPZ47_00095 [Pseudomonas viciae]